MEQFTVKVPASTANLGPGFDTFGLALPLYLTICVKTAEKTSIKLIGKHLRELPVDENNLIYKSIQHLYKLENKNVPPLALEIESEIPLSRGLGSSGAAIVGGLLAGNNLLGNPKSIDDIFRIAAEIEGHPDNVGASLYGGFVIAVNEGKEIILEKIAFPEDLKIILAIPDYTLATSMARQAIPASIPLKDTALNIGYSALFMVYLLTGQTEKLPLAIKDRVHQPYRQKYVKGLERLLTLENKNIYSAVLSGAGPTILLFVKDNDITNAKKKLVQVAEEESINFEIKTLSYAKQGAEVI